MSIIPFIHRVSPAESNDNPSNDKTLAQQLPVYYMIAQQWAKRYHSQEYQSTIFDTSSSLTRRDVAELLNHILTLSVCGTYLDVRISSDVWNQSLHWKNKNIYNGSKPITLAKRANQDIYDDFKLKKTLWSP